MFKNVILITIDSLRADHLRPYGYYIETPNIDELASQGILFRNAYANSPGTPSSFQAILTSTYPMMYGGYGKMSKHRPYLPSILKSCIDNIYTIGITSNPYLSHYYGYNRGFDYFYDGFQDEHTSTLISRGLKFLKHLLEPSPYVVGSTLNEIAKKQLLKAKTKRFFLWIHYMDVHFPYFYKSKLRNLVFHRKIHKLNSLILDVIYDKTNSVDENTLRDLIYLYDEGIQRVDEYIGDLISFLKKNDLLDDTLLILVSDHGDEFMEHGGLAHTPKLYNELLHIPLIISNPSLKKQKCRKVVDQLDIVPTISKALGCPISPKWLGNPLFDQNKIDSKMKEKVVISEVANTSISDKISLDEWRVSILKGKWKLHYYHKTKSIELYDTSRDPQEKMNIASKFDNISGSLLKTIKDYMKFAKSTWDDEKLKKAIKNLKLKGKI
ncbi:sulfatase [Thermococcus sp. LS2]|uniref:sulfatase n=1 Tax=Thermococcus sp. LS2 TaxID=1638260 RepID=UPI00143C6859|nr:sulfatase [Thermococcus sp. LS2]NJE12846.1 DUF229 domain-containing protein [Thermococcus sp. LS2]